MIAGVSRKSFEYYHSYGMGVRFDWEPTSKNADPAIEEWTKQRRLFHHEFLSKLESWGEKYRRIVNCRRKWDGVEVTEYGVRTIFA
jgi:hypothetical protein